MGMYKDKYFKYKNKYLNLLNKKMIGGMNRRVKSGDSYTSLLEPVNYPTSDIPKNTTVDPSPDISTDSSPVIEQEIISSIDSFSVVEQEIVSSIDSFSEQEIVSSIDSSPVIEQEIVSSIDSSPVIEQETIYQKPIYTQSIISENEEKKMLPKLGHGCWKKIVNAKSNEEYGNRVIKYNLIRYKSYTSTKKIGSVKRTTNIFCSQNYPNFMFMVTKDVDLRTGYTKNISLFYRDFVDINICDHFPNPHKRIPAEEIFNDGLKRECKENKKLNYNIFEPSPTYSLPSNLSPTSSIDNYSIIPNSNNVFINDYRPKRFNNLDGFIPDYSSKNFNQENEDSIDIDWRKFNEELKNESDMEEYIEKKSTKKKTSKKSTKKKTSK